MGFSSGFKGLKLGEKTGNLWSVYFAILQENRSFIRGHSR